MKKLRVCAIHDISGFGRCSLTVALPILSAAGIETSVIPTAVLSTHTGGFDGFTYRDLSDDILPFARHWQGLDIHFDAIYTGFLGSIEQCEIVREAIDLIKSDDTLLVVDPAMADFGELYKTFPADFPDAMRGFCETADVIIPNLTEAALLLDQPYREGPFTHNEIQQILIDLTGIGPECVVLTGVSLTDEPGIGSAGYESKTGTFSLVMDEKIEPMYHGTGDVFASVLCAALVRGRSLKEACRAAVRFTVDAIRRTKEAGADNRFGVDFEPGLYSLRRLIDKQ